MSGELPYNKDDKYSILEYAERLIGKSLRSIVSGASEEEDPTRSIGKGDFGNMVEQLYFQYKPNSLSQADFPEAGIELKTSPLKEIRKGLVAKERLVFNIINYMEEHRQVFRSSSFWRKNAELLVLFYLHDKQKLPIDYLFKIVRLWRFPEKDLKIIIDDWNTIVGKIRSGRAHELSEGDTVYLGACTKGATKASVRKQPFSEELAMQRAYSLKPKYLNFIIEQSLSGAEHSIDEDEYEYLLSETSMSREAYAEYKKLCGANVEPLVKSISEYRKGQSFEDLVIERFEPFRGMSLSQLITHLNLQIDRFAKNKFNVIARRIMGVKAKYIEEFEKGDVQMKTIVLERNGNLRESMSFQQIQYKEIIDEVWLESYWFQVLTKRFFFVVFKKDDNQEPRLHKVMFWTMPNDDLKIAELFWEDTRSKVMAGDFDNFIKISDNRICHVRPKARDAHDMMETHLGRMEKKKAYWLNSGYIKEQLFK